MHEAEPNAIIIGDSEIRDNGMRTFLDDIGADGYPIYSDTNDGERIVEIAGRTCYKSFGVELNKNLTKVRTDSHEYIGNILKTHHGSVLEHATTTVGFVDVSRIFTHELVRHRAGCAYSQESMRFVRLEDVGMYIPDCIKNDPVACGIFIQATINAEKSYAALVKHLITDSMPFSKKKEITSACRRIAPSGHATNIVVTANHRAWRHLFELRTAPGVEEEIGVVFSKLGVDFKNRYSAFYQDMNFVGSDSKQKWATITFEHSKI